MKYLAFLSALVVASFFALVFYALHSDGKFPIGTQAPRYGTGDRVLVLPKNTDTSHSLSDEQLAVVLFSRWNGKEWSYDVGVRDHMLEVREEQLQMISQMEWECPSSGGWVEIEGKYIPGPPMSSSEPHAVPLAPPLGEEAVEESYPAESRSERDMRKFQRPKKEHGI